MKSVIYVALICSQQSTVHSPLLKLETNWARCRPRSLSKINICLDPRWRFVFSNSALRRKLFIWSKSIGSGRTSHINVDFACWIQITQIVIETSTEFERCSSLAEMQKPVGNKIGHNKMRISALRSKEFVFHYSAPASLESSGAHKWEMDTRLLHCAAKAVLNSEINAI